MHLHAASRRALMAALGLNATFFVVEVIAGLRANSLALLSDAGHMLGDVGAVALALAASVVAVRPASADKTFGYWRSEILAAFVNGVALVVIAALVAAEALRRVGAPPAVEGGTVTWVAAAGLVINLVVAWMLASGSRSDLNVRGAFLHAASDALGSLGALVAGVLVVWRGWTLADPVASLFIALLVALAGARLLRDTVHVLMEGVPARIRMDRLRAAIEDTAGVQAVHDLHVWSVASRFAVLSAHVVTEQELSPSQGQFVLARLRQVLRDDFALEHVTLQLEAADPADPTCSPCEERPAASNRT